jgi:hypothetical protein
MKTCIKCNISKPLTEFNTYKSIKGELKHKARCKSCQAIYQKRYLTKECPIKLRNRKLYARYGITHDQYVSLLEKQNNACLICESPATSPTSLFVDHNHDTGEVRGLLCHHCNTALGLFKDSPQLLKKAVSYLEDKGDYSNLNESISSVSETKPV